MHTIEVHYQRGDRLAIAIRGHEVIVDQPLDDGGADTGPTPTELWVAGLAACVVFYAERFLRRHDLSVEDLRASCRWSFAEDRPARVERIEIRLELPAVFPADLLPRLEAVLDRCAVHESLRQPPPVEITTHTPAVV
jgi:putative redox protein